MFKKGDYVVFLDEPIIRVIKEVFKISHINGNMVVFEKCTPFASFGFLNQLRLASEEEVLIGYRE